MRGWDYYCNTSDPRPGPGHGTHVAGTAAAVGFNSLSVIGISPRAKIVSLKIGNNIDGGGSVTAMRYAREYLASLRARVDLDGVHDRGRRHRFANGGVCAAGRRHQGHVVECVWEIRVSDPASGHAASDWHRNHPLEWLSGVSRRNERCACPADCCLTHHFSENKGAQLCLRPLPGYDRHLLRSGRWPTRCQKGSRR